MSARYLGFGLGQDLFFSLFLFWLPIKKCATFVLFLAGVIKRYVPISGRYFDCGLPEKYRQSSAQYDKVVFIEAAGIKILPGPGSVLPAGLNPKSALIYHKSSIHLRLFYTNDDVLKFCRMNNYEHFLPATRNPQPATRNPQPAPSF